MFQLSMRSHAMKRLFSEGAGKVRSVSSIRRNSELYELRKYDIKPDRMQDFLSLMKEDFHPRLQHSPCFGYWFAEFGALNQAVHIWKYDSYSQRAEVRAALAKDKDWNENFMSKVTQCWSKQENAVLHLADWCHTNMVDKNTGVFELVTYGMKMGGPALWEEKLKRSLLAHARLGYTNLVGAWYTNIGDHNNVEVLWRFESMDARREGREKAHKDRVVVNTVRDNLENVNRHSSLILNPYPLP